MNIEIESNTRVTLNFSLSLENGEEVDSNFGADPVSFVMGDGSLLPGFERRLLGMRPGDEAEFRIPPAEGFGEPQDDNVQSLPRRDFDEESLAPGMLFSFADAAGGEVPGMVSEVDEETVIDEVLSDSVMSFQVKQFHTTWPYEQDELDEMGITAESSMEELVDAVLESFYGHAGEYWYAESAEAMSEDLSQISLNGESLSFECTGWEAAD